MSRTELTYLEALTGAKWTGIGFSDRGFLEHKQSRSLCAAIARSLKESFQLLSSDLRCPGALRCLGIEHMEDTMAAHISEETGADMKRIRNIIAHSPRMEETVFAVELGAKAEPALCAGYIAPEAAMKLLRQWQMVYGTSLSMVLSSFMAVCSAVVAAYKNKTLVFSMGCPESRRKGGIRHGQLFAVLPGSIVRHMQEEIPLCQHMNTSVPAAGTILSNFRR